MSISRKGSDPAHKATKKIKRRELLPRPHLPLTRLRHILLLAQNHHIYFRVHLIVYVKYIYHLHHQCFHTPTLPCHFQMNPRQVAVLHGQLEMIVWAEHSWQFETDIDNNIKHVRVIRL